MSLESLCPEKQSLLPVAGLQPASEEDSNACNRIESALPYVCITTLVALLGSLYYKDSLPSSSPFATILQLLNAGILSSLWASLPAPAVLFVCAPYFAERSKINMVRYWIYLLYIVGVAVGALIFGSEARAARCETTMG